MINYYEPNIDLTLLGCGFLGNYHIGAICLLTQIWPLKPYNRICGASCGGLVGALFIAGIRIDKVLNNAMNVLKQLRAFLQNPTHFVSLKDLVEQILEKMLPTNAHKLCNGRLVISLTKLWPFENKLVSEFETRQDLIDAIAAGCFIPLWSGSITSPKYKGEKYIDGAYSNNMPKFELNAADQRQGIRQVEICAFAGEVEVSPPDRSNFGLMRVLGTKYYLSWDNIIRSTKAMIPLHVNNYKTHLFEGHRDMKDYVLRSNLIKCRKCYQDYKNQSVIIIENQSRESYDRKSCLLCLRLLEQVDSLKVPQEFLTIFEE